MKKRTHKMEKLARIYDAEILPVWAERFGKMLLRGLSVPSGGQVLDVACGTGYPAVEVLRRMDERSRLIAIDASSAMLDVARKKIAETGRKGVFFRTESAEPKLSFADDVYDLVLCNLGLTEMPSIPRALADFARVTAPMGEVRCTLPLAGTFQEFYDIYREVLIKHDKHEALERLDAHLARYPTAEQCHQWLAQVGLRDVHVEVEAFTMLFKSSREFFFAPVIEYGPLVEWKAIAGSGQEMQDVFWYIKEAIDAYFVGRAFEVTVKAGCLLGRKVEISDDMVTGRVPRVLTDAPSDEGTADAASDQAGEAGASDDAFSASVVTPEIVELPLPPGEPALVDEGAVISESLAEDDGPTRDSVPGVPRPVPEGESLPRASAVDAAAPTGRAAASESGSITSELDISELEEISETLEGASPAEDVELDAFIEGRPRPEHLDRDD